MGRCIWVHGVGVGGGGQRQPVSTFSPQALETPPIHVPMAPGELLDRIAILQIKLTRISDGKELQNIAVEAEQLRAVRDRVIVPSEELNILSDRLASVNERLWDIEKHVRACESNKDFGPRFIELARSVYITDNERSAIKRQINELLGSRPTFSGRPDDSYDSDSIGVSESNND